MKAKRVSRKSSAIASGKPRLLVAKHARSLLPGLYQQTQGKPFSPPVFRSWLRRRLPRKQWQLPTAEEATSILRTLAQKRRLAGGSMESIGTWEAQGVQYADPDGSADVSNIVGFSQGAAGAGSKIVMWHESGHVYRLQKAEPVSRGKFQVARSPAFKRIRCSVAKRSLPPAPGKPKSDEFKGSLILEPQPAKGSALAPRYTLIYLHSFSNKGTDYTDYPQYFGVGGAHIRVVLPTAPLLEQTCFKHWMVWRGKRMGWRPIRFNSWFDYITDRAGSRENDIGLESLVAMRARIHGLIQREVNRLGGDARRVILGGASQGCCVALDAAMTYPDELGGVVGIVGHILGCTPLDVTKRNMPIHLFHEASDKEMRWKWVEGTVQRLTDAGFNVTSQREKDPADCGHWVQDIEGAWIRSGLRRIIFPSAL